MQTITRPILRRPTHRLPLRFMLLLALLVTPSVLPADETGAIPGPDLFFEANVGQFPETVLYVARGPSYHLLIDERGTTYDLGALDGERQIRVVMVGGRAPQAVVASESLPGKVHYFLGNEPERWVTGASTWRRVRLRGV